MEIKDHLLNSKVFGRPWSDRHEKWRAMYNDLNIQPESLLNIGIGPKFSAQRWTKLLHQVWPSLVYFVNLELDGKVAKKARQRGSPYISNVEVGDVRKIGEIFGEDYFDIIFWSHGPEHIKREEWAATFEQMKSVTKVIIMQCPWGSGYNTNPGHISKSIMRNEFEPFGFTVSYTGKKNSKFGEILAYKVTNEN